MQNERAGRGKAINYILNKNTVDDKDIIYMMHIVRDVHHELADISEKLLTDSGIYFNKFWTEKFISAEIPDAQAEEELIKQKEFFSRLQSLLPEFLRFFNFECDSQIIGFIELIDDCHSDFWIVSSASREDKTRRQAAEAIQTAAKNVRKLSDALQVIEQHVGHEYDKLRHAYMSDRGVIRVSNMDYRGLVEELKFALGAIELCSMRALEDNDFLYITNSRSRMFVVETAYKMSKYWNGPAFKTTPGSDFSAVCAILYEMVSGLTDEGLAGAIARYSRSEDKKKVDEDDEQDKERGGQLEQDNFRSVNRPIIDALMHYDTYVSMKSASESSDCAKGIIFRLREYALNLVEASKKKYGPFLVWAEHLPNQYLEKDMKEYQDLEKRRRDLIIALGQNRRNGSE